MKEYIPECQRSTVIHLTFQLEKEKLLHAKELKELEDEIENLKRLIEQLQDHYETEVGSPFLDNEAVDPVKDENSFCSISKI